MAFACRTASLFLMYLTMNSPWILAAQAAPPPTLAPGLNRQQPAMIRGSVVDRTGAVIPGATIELIRDGQPQAQRATSGSDGQFSFSSLGPGPFELTVTASGFAARTVKGNLLSGENQLVPPIELAIANAGTSVQVSATQEEIAEDQIKEQEQQRVLKVVPNFYVSYVQDAASLNSRQKFELAWKTLADPFSFLAVGVIAGVQQSQNSFPGYGQGAQGYAKRYGASYGDFVSGTLIGAAILPSVFKQDPRYFYKGAGSKKSRILYALANSVICKGDNRRWQVNYSSILGNLAAGGLSNLYYPDQDRNGTRLMFENMGIGIGAAGAINVLQEFVVRKPKSRDRDQQPARQ